MSRCASQQNWPLHVRFGSKAEILDLSTRCPLYPPKADIDRRGGNVRFVPEPDLCSATKTALIRSTDRSFFRPYRGELCSVALRPLVGDRAALYHIVDGFRDVGGVIADALDVLGAEHEMDAEGDVARIFHHVGQELAKQRGAHGVDLLVTVPNRECLLEVTADVAVKHLLELGEDQRAHMFDAAQQIGWGKFAPQCDDTLPGVFRHVADPLEVAGNAQRAYNLAQVHRHRLTTGDREHRFFLDLMPKGIDTDISCDHLLCEVSVAAHQR